MIRVKKQGFNLTEAMVAIAVIGVLCALCFSMFNRSTIDDRLINAKQARLENTLRVAALSIIGKEGDLPAAKACSAPTLKTLLRSKIANSTDADNVTINGKAVAAIKVKNAGLICVDVSDNCNAIWDGNIAGAGVSTDAPVVLYAIPDEKINKITGVPLKALPTGSQNTPAVGASSPAVPSNPIVAAVMKPSEVKTIYNYEPRVTESAPTLLGAGEGECPLPDPYVPVENTKENACWTPNYTYADPCNSGSELPIYYMVSMDESKQTCTSLFCEGNGIGNDGQLVTHGKVTNACASSGGNATQCACPQDRKFFVAEYSKNGITGLCVEDCCAVGMVKSDQSPRTCECPEGTSWSTTLNKCVDGKCPEEYLMWDGTECVCDNSKVQLADDEIYSSDVQAGCKEKCDTANYYFPNESRDECVQHLPECLECLKELSMTDYTCQCKAASSLTNSDLILCDIPDNKYYTGEGDCVQTCDISYKLRDVNNISSCVCPAVKPADMMLGNYEKYDTQSYNCRSCGNVAETNRIYDQSLVNCECLPSASISYNSNEIYDITQANCKNICPEGQIPDATHTYCYVPVCAPTLPSDFVVPAGKFYNPLVGLEGGCVSDCPRGAYCPGTNGTPDTTIDPNPTLDNHNDNPEVPDGIQVVGIYKCPCGYYGELQGLSATSCSGACPAGYNCPKGSKNATQNPCTGSQLCRAGVCEIEECSQYRQPDANHIACVCKSAEELQYKGDNWIYDTAQDDCQSQCSGVLVRSEDKLQCVCPTVKPSTMIIPAGKYYNKNAVASGCLSDCPPGNYCPGTTPSAPDVPVVDPDDPVPTVNPDYPSGDVYKCLCGYYGSLVGNSKAKCNGSCYAGYKCPAGSTSPSAVKCNSVGKVCAVASCTDQECISPLVANTNYDACICPASSEITLVPGYYYDASVLTGENLCQSKCPTTASAIALWISNNQSKFTNDKIVYDSTAVGCISTCSNTNFVASTDKLQCVCGLSPNAVPAGKYLVSNATECQFVDCPVGHYCPGSNPDPNPNPIPDPNYPNNDVIFCPCGTFGATTGLKTYSCSGMCSAGYNCPTGSVSSTQVQCQNNQLCRAGVCEIEECSQYRKPDINHTACVCKSANEITYKGAKWVYDDTQEECQYECEGIKERSLTNPMQCVCPSSKPAGYSIPAGKQYDPSNDFCISNCPIGYYCPGTTGDIVNNDPDDTKKIALDDNHPEVLKCICGYYGATVGKFKAKCDGACHAGYNCPAGSTSPLQIKCTGNQLCKAGVCEVEECSQYRQPDTNHTNCECKPKDIITYKGDNWYYDLNQADCQSQCEGVLVRSDDQTKCVCPSFKPSTMVIPAGKYYNKNAVSSGCLSDCPAGSYCPGTKTSNPDQPNVDPDDPNPIATPGYPGVVFKCMCGYYGAKAGNSAAKCDGACSAGYTCPAGSISNKAQACASGKICKSGVCEPQECPNPLIANTEQTQCICPASSSVTLEPGYYYDATVLSGNHLCQAACPTNISEIAVWIQQHPERFAGKEKAVYDSTAIGCVSECTQTNFIASVDRTSCICGLGPNSVPAGKYLISSANECKYEDCPIGHYCPGSNQDPNPSPTVDPNYPAGVIFCPCGTYGSTKNLGTYNCSGQCSTGYYCPVGSISATGKTTPQGQEHACTTGQLCQQGTCTPGNCDNKFPLTSTDPYTSCSVCMTEAAIRAKDSSYFKAYEVYDSTKVTGDKLCKTCKAPRIYDASGTNCVCPADMPFIYNDTCNKCQNWGTLFFARNMSSSEPGCTLYKFMNGDVSCFSGGKARQVDDNMKAAASKLSSTDKNRTFQGVYAYMVALSPNGNSASVVGTFTIDSWYAIFPDDEKAYNARTYDQYLVKGSCATMCKNAAECINTCEYLLSSISSNTMMNSCKYVDTSYANRIGNSYGNAFDEFCSGGSITMKNGCVYNVGAFLRRYSSPLVLDLKGDGFKFTTVADGVTFDLDKDGYAEKISWTAPQTSFDDAFLVLDKNKNGQVDNGGELFGDQNGEENGFKELAKYDDNKDKVINKEDKIYSELLLWVDFNKNAKVDNGELKTLTEANVTEISLDYDKKLDSKGNILKDMYGNITGFVGSFKMMVKNAAGKLVETIRTMIDVFFMSA